MLSSPTTNLTTTLTVEVNGLRNRKGQVCISIFADADAFPKDAVNAVQSQCVEITDIPLQVTFENLQPGNYAITVMHDENRDGQLNRNFLGIPTEGFGFSRNPTIYFGAPKFDDTVFTVTETNTTTQINLNYLLGS
ncbi:MAG: DUF2141 domain-containing protein [Scytonematopsis contorta HA4267-MV1]|jgi:uncharacterized protein (DUF2141 family)|nr:DUF2141 domain-containing protein [Scytonematopsis contorta HA4267-MV1]